MPVFVDLFRGISFCGRMVLENTLEITSPRHAEMCTTWGKLNTTKGNSDIGLKGETCTTMSFAPFLCFRVLTLPTTL